MTKAQLINLNSRSVQGEKTAQAKTLKEKVESIVDKRRSQTLELVTDALLYYSKVGHTELEIDALPSVHAADKKFVVQWLEDQGFEVKRHRFSARMVVVLQEKE